MTRGESEVMRIPGDETKPQRWWSNTEKIKKLTKSLWRKTRRGYSFSLLGEMKWDGMAEKPCRFRRVEMGKLARKAKAIWWWREGVVVEGIC